MRITPAALTAFLLPLLVAASCRAQPLVGAWYFTLWHKDAASGQLAAAQKLYGTPDPWGGVRQYAQGHGAAPITNPDGSTPDYSARKPQADYYDLSSPQAIETQFAEAGHIGLNFFAFYFYIDGATGKPLPISSPVQAFYDAPNRHGTALVLAPIVNANGGRKLTIETFRATLLPILTDYLASPANLRIDGRPVLIDWWFAPQDPPNDYPAIYEALRQSVRARTHTDPYIVKLFAANVAPENITGAVQKLRPDAATCFSFPMQPAENYTEYTESFRPGMQRQSQAVDGQVPYFPCSSIGQDARPWFGVGWQNKAGMESRGYTLGVTPQAYRQSLAATAKLTQSPLDPPHIAILYAWNEWGEAAADIEPSAKTGDTYGQAVRQAFGLTPRP